MLIRFLSVCTRLRTCINISIWCGFVLFRVAVVTGGNKGIGLEVCRQLASRGVMVILTARDERKGSKAVGMLHGSGLPNVQFHRLDVSDPTDTARLAEFIREKFGRLDILVRSFFRNIRVDLIWSIYC
jgi:(+)-neomenthol dehydrogenase